MTDNGPYESERQARAAAHAVIPPESGRVILSAAQNRTLLRQALEAAGVELGPYDDRIAGWLAGWEDAICMVVAGWIARAAQRPEGMAIEWGYRRRGSQSAEPCISEKAARYMAGIAPDKTEVVTREVTPWAPVPGGDEDNA